MIVEEKMEFYDFEPERIQILREIMFGLSKKQKMIHPKFFYDKRGSEIFEKICELPEYYPTRAEKEILGTYGKEIAQYIGPQALLIEPGAGNGEKTKLILRELKDPVGYVPIEISKEILLRMTEEMFIEFPELQVLPVCADFTKKLELPSTVSSQNGRRVLFFPGSTIGNLRPLEAIEFLKGTGSLLQTGGGFILGVDLKKNENILQEAYDDRAGVTATFNLNLLNRLNRELQATFDLDNFEHLAVYNKALGRVEMHLKSMIPHLVKIENHVIKFREGETIHTESSYKYSISEFSDLCSAANLRLRKTWLDSQELFCVYYFEKE